MVEDLFCLDLDRVQVKRMPRNGMMAEFLVDRLEESLAFTRVDPMAEIAVVVANGEKAVDEMLSFFWIFWMVVAFLVVTTHAGFCDRAYVENLNVDRTVTCNAGGALRFLFLRDHVLEVFAFFEAL